MQRANGNAGAGGGGMKVKKKKLKFQKLLGVNATYTMVKEQCDCLNVCVYYSTSMTTIIFRGTPHLIYLGPVYIIIYLYYTFTLHIRLVIVVIMVCCCAVEEGPQF